MNINCNNKCSIIVVVALLAAAIGILLRYFSADITKVTLSQPEQQQVDKLLQNSPTRCVGSYLINLPKSFKIDQSMTFYYQNG